MSVRDYILSEAPKELRPNYKEIATSVANYLTIMHRGFQELLGAYGRYPSLPEEQKNKIKSIVVGELFNALDPKSPARMFNKLNRLFMEVEHNYTEADQSKWGRAFRAVTQVGGLITAILASAHTFMKLKEWYRRYKEKVAYDRIIPTIFNSVITPELKNIYEDIHEGKIKDENHLHLKFYKVVDKINSMYPGLSPYLETWA